jgi:hypothetical protein
VKEGKEQEHAGDKSHETDKQDKPPPKRSQHD